MSKRDCSPRVDVGRGRLRAASSGSARHTRRPSRPSEGYSLTYLPFIARATIDALHAFPVVNSCVPPRRGHSRSSTASVNLGIAVDMNQEGLVVVTAQAMPTSMRIDGPGPGIRGMPSRPVMASSNPDDVSAAPSRSPIPVRYGSFMTHRSSTCRTSRSCRPTPSPSGPR